MPFPPKNRLRNRSWRWAIRLAVLAGLVWLSVAPGDPALYPAPGPGRQIAVIDHGYHAGLALRSADLRWAAIGIARSDPEKAMLLRALAARWPDAAWIEFGWGDRAFYQATARVSDIQIDLALAAVLWPTPSVVQAVPLWQPPATAFPHSGQAALALSDQGFLELADGIAAAIAPGPYGLPAPVGTSLYGAGEFLPSSLSYHGLRTCNQWVSGLLRQAGVPSSWFWSVTSTGLMAELRLRT